MWTRVAAVDAHLWTWEVVTGFDGVLDSKTLHARFAEDFPSVVARGSGGECAAPVFREMVSFNSTDGRKHRYLVMRPDVALGAYRKDFDRVLPRVAEFYGCADKLMREGECAGGESACCGSSLRESCGNCRFAFLDNGSLYILVFFEGRLCHWTCEPDCDAAAAGERLDRFDEFLRRDDLFSRAETWCKRLVCVDGAGEREHREWWRRACKDPFWTAVDLDECTGLKPRAKRKIVLAALAGMAFAFAGGVTFFDNGIAYTRPVPDLSPVPEYVFGVGGEDPYETEVDEKFDGEKLRAKKVRINAEPAEQGTAETDTVLHCTAPVIKLYGVVEGRLVQASIDGGERAWLRMGDSAGNYKVADIGKDNAVFVCGENRMEVYNGR